MSSFAVRLFLLCLLIVVSSQSESPDIYLLNYTGFPHSHCDQLYLEQYMNYTESSEYLTGESNGDGSLTSCLVGCLNSYDCIGLSFSDRTVRKNGRCGLVAWYCPPEKLKSVPGYHYYVKKANIFPGFQLHGRTNCTAIALSSFFRISNAKSEAECHQMCLKYPWCRTFYYWRNPSYLQQNTACRLSQRYCPTAYVSIDHGLLYTRIPSNEEWDMLFSRNHQAILKDFDLIQNVDCYPLESTSYYPPVFADSPIKCALICAEDPFCVSFSYCYIDDGRDCNHRNELASNCQLFHRFCPAKDRKPNSVKYHYLKKAIDLEGFRTIGHRICPSFLNGSHVNWIVQDMTEAQCAERCTSAGVRCMGFIYTKMGLSDLEGQRMKLTFTIASEAVLHQCGLVTNRSCSQAMMIESHWLYYLRKGKAPNTVELIEQKDFFRSKNVKCESDPYTEAVRTIQAASVSQCQAECLTGRDSCVAFTFDQTDKTNSQCYLWSRTCTSKELIGPTPNIDYYVSKKPRRADAVSGFRLYEDVSCGWGSYYFLHKPLSDSFDAASVKDCADWCRANEFCRSFVFYGPKGGWRNIHGTWTDPGYEQKWKSKKILTCNTSYVLCHPEALRSLNDNKEFTRSYYEKIKLVND